jgi:(p)ppGpp synthase/HD superfamily hydrolase
MVSSSGSVKLHQPLNKTASTFSDRFDKALAYATIIHAGQLRKATQTPYIAHLLGVASIALEYGANEDEAIAALLHDAGEDAGGEGRIADIRARFGAAIAKIVEGCTDTLEIPKPPWRERKEKYITHLDSADGATILVSASDKLHNTRAIVRALRHEGDSAFKRFKGKKDGTLWYYRALVTAFRKHGDSELIDELERVVTEMELLASVSAAARRSKSLINP